MHLIDVRIFVSFVKKKVQKRTNNSYTVATRSTTSSTSQKSEHGGLIEKVKKQFKQHILTSPLKTLGGRRTLKTQQQRYSCDTTQKHLIRIGKIKTNHIST